MSAPTAANTPLGDALEKSVWELHQLEKILELGAPSDDRVIEKVEDFMKTLPKLREASDASGSIEIPVDVVREVDQGKKPMGYMINQILAAGRANEVVKGKANVYREFVDALEAKLGETGQEKTGGET
ncbi:Mediator complex, subunit Med10 [Ostreococcus tauri]|uniref:Mediator of RNA polymerase II transcription subunit 10 n=1 Tax=Ostreococcus tauri TaxID=70448 RepID=A0A090MEU5_OSTTA|nr:Mediator complex, subunit Med10 [Ostreococcus tauri]OUS47005.1 hypothetical protein BE221DRAFT_145423 [Ostreococcus tauri]CEG01507.1 Mediator complex, subunit Med10 [Ostreococcus tauri]|eukprot:XP_022841001.1 Mediator complex, subunit Med10 [Ostreococcus tauri]